MYNLLKPLAGNHQLLEPFRWQQNRSGRNYVLLPPGHHGSTALTLFFEVFVDLERSMSEYTTCESGGKKSNLLHGDHFCITYPDIRDMVNAGMFEVEQPKMSMKVEVEPRPEDIDKLRAFAITKYEQDCETAASRRQRYQGPHPNLFDSIQ